MLKDGKILIGKNDNYEANLLLSKANRHGLITGATGTGKTISLKVLAESFSSAGVPVFMVDVKGDLAGTAFIGEDNENVRIRVEKLKLDTFKYDKYPCVFYDIYGKLGHPLRTTVGEMGHRLLSKVLGLSEVQDSVLTIVYKIASDEGKELDTLEDLQSMLVYVANKRTELSQVYGNIASQTLTTIQRNVLELIEDLKDGNSDNVMFGYPPFNVQDLRGLDVDTGYGRINILDAQELFKHSDSYAATILTLLDKVYDSMPEVGDVDKPKLVLFFDEAHLLFSDMSKAMLEHVVKIVKLIRSKGVGVYFISQSPADIPDEVLSQLGNKIQHALRVYTPSEEKAIKVAADSFRVNPKFDTMKAIQNLGTGEALISLIDENGEPTVVEQVTILPPQSRMGTIIDMERQAIINNSPIVGKYEKVEDRVSAKENNEEVFNKIEQEKQEKEQAKLDEKNAKEEAKRLKQEEAERAREAREAERKKKQSLGYKIGRKAENKIIDKTLNKILKGFFK